MWCKPIRPKVNLAANAEWLCDFIIFNRINGSFYIHISGLLQLTDVNWVESILIGAGYNMEYMWGVREMHLLHKISNFESILLATINSIFIQFHNTYNEFMIPLYPKERWYFLEIYLHGVHDVEFRTQLYPRRHVEMTPSLSLYSLWLRGDERKKKREKRIFLRKFSKCVNVFSKIDISSEYRTIQRRPSKKLIHTI